MTKSIRQFSEIDVNAVPLVGGKGANLGEMTRAGLPVPPGFCVTADGYREFTASAQETIDQILKTTSMDDPDDVEKKTARLTRPPRCAPDAARNRTRDTRCVCKIIR